MARLSYLDAGRVALAEEMRRDPSVWALGEDLGRGGVFGQYRGLVDEFGSDRISDAPISEACILGAAVGAAMMGTRPVVEMRFADFALCAVDELVNQAAKARYMFGGQTRVPIVVREPIGLWRSSAAQHSQSLEAWYAHIPGLVVVCPSTPADNKGLLKSAIRCDDPVVYMEHKSLWPLEDEGPRRSGPCRAPGQGPDRARGERRDDRVLVAAGPHRCRSRREARGDRHRRGADRPAHAVAVGQGGRAGERAQDRPAHRRA
jgi:pyruvate dehydrogenase E1 component beta subunit